MHIDPSMCVLYMRSHRRRISEENEEEENNNNHIANERWMLDFVLSTIIKHAYAYGLCMVWRHATYTDLILNKYTCVAENKSLTSGVYEMKHNFKIVSGKVYEELFFSINEHRNMQYKIYKIYKMLICIHWYKSSWCTWTCTWK